MEFAGIFPALTTPFSESGAVSLSCLRHNIHRYNQTDLAGYVVLGSTGESVLLSPAEMDAILAVAKDETSDEKVIIAGCGAESTMETIARVKRAAELGYHAALVKTPHYYKPSYKPEVLIAHYRAVADASPIPVLLYSVPQFTGITLETPAILALAQHPNIIGIKDSSGDVRRVGEVVAGAPAAFHVLTGGAAVVLPALVVGARGAILALASALPEKCVALFQLLRNGHLEKARELQLILAGASKLIVSECGIAGVKFVMDHRGYHGGVPRLPLQPLQDGQKGRILELLAQLEPAAARV